MTLRRLLVPTLVAFLAATPFCAAPALAQAPGGAPPSVGVVQVQQRQVTETEAFVGRIQSIERVDLTARVTAFIEQRLFTEGAEVPSGALLYRLERGPFEAAVAQQQAAVAQATASLNNATIQMGRATELLSTPAGQRSRIDDAREKQAMFAAQLQAAQAQLRSAQINLDYTEIRAPIGGKIGRSSFTIGNVVTPASGPLARIVSQDPMYVLFPMAARSYFGLLKRFADQGGLAAVGVRMQLPDGSADAQIGKIDFVDNTIAATTDTLVVRASIANPANAQGLRPLIDGAFVGVTVTAAEPAMALTVPRAAVLTDQQGTYVYVVGNDKKAEQRRVRLGQLTLAYAVVASGLTEGEAVVLEGLQRVRPGADVNPTPIAAAGAPPSGAPPAGAPPSGAPAKS